MRSKNCLKFTISMRSRGPHQNREFKAIFLQIATKIANFPLDLIKIMNLRQFFCKLPQKWGSAAPLGASNNARSGARIGQTCDCVIESRGDASHDI